MKSVTTTTVHIELGTAFWLLVGLIVAGIFLYSRIGSERMNQVVRGGINDAFKTKLQSL